jgi:hypothetical protein
VTVPESQERRVELGPLFLSGFILIVYGLLRRRVLAVAAGLGAIWLDQRSEFGRSLKEQAKERFMTVEYAEVQSDETAAPD